MSGAAEGGGIYGKRANANVGKRVLTVKDLPEA
jgi:hypothetical protein